MARQREKAGPPAQTSAEMPTAPQKELAVGGPQFTVSEKNAGISYKTSESERYKLHGDGVVGVADHVPARTVAGVGED